MFKGQLRWARLFDRAAGKQVVLNEVEAGIAELQDDLASDLDSSKPTDMVYQKLTAKGYDSIQIKAFLNGETVPLKKVR